jgi:hypothetical protein
MDVKFPPGKSLRVGDKFRVTVDVDSLCVISKNLKDDEVAEFADTIVSPESTLRLKRYLLRTNGTDRTRFKVCLPREKMYHYTKPKTKEKIRNINLEDCKNIVLFEVTNGTIKFTVHYILLDGGYLNSRYFFNKQLAALASCMRMTQILGSTEDENNTVYPTSDKNVMDDSIIDMEVPVVLDKNMMTRLVFLEYLEVMRESELVEGISANSLIAKNKLNPSTHTTLKATSARIFIRSLFQVLRKPAEAIEILKKRSTTIKPWTTRFHKVKISEEFLEEDLIFTCQLLSRKGIIMAQDPGTKNRFPTNAKQDQKDFNFASGANGHKKQLDEFIGDRINAKVKELRQFLDPKKHMDDATTSKCVDAQMYRFGRSDDNVLRFFDYGIVIKPLCNASDLFIPTGPEGMYVMRNILNKNRLQHDYDKGKLIRELFNVAVDFSNAALYEQLVELCTDDSTDGTLTIEEIMDPDRDHSGVNGEIDLQIINYLSTAAEDEENGRQNNLAEGEDIPHTADTLLNMLNKGYDQYPSFGTLGQCANIHTGMCIFKSNQLQHKYSFTQPSLIKCYVCFISYCD